MAAAFLFSPPHVLLQIYNNIIHDVDAPGISVWGGFNIAIQYNTLYRTGLSYSPLAVRFGIRTCDGEPCWGIEGWPLVWQGCRLALGAGVACKLHALRPGASTKAVLRGWGSVSCCSGIPGPAGETEDPLCTTYVGMGGWGPGNSVPPYYTEVRIPNKAVTIANNVIYNPPG